MEKWHFATWPACGVVDPMLEGFGCASHYIMRAKTVADQFELMWQKIDRLNHKLFSQLVEIYITLSLAHCDEVCLHSVYFGTLRRAVLIDNNQIQVI